MSTEAGLSMRAVLADGGEVGRDLLDVDWSSTSVGDPDTWSVSLRNAVRILITSKFSMWMAWGDDLTFFCNAAYRRDTLGTKYPWALGRPAQEVWSEIWADVSPRVERVLSTGEATWDESLQLFLERDGYVEETYHTFSYSPLVDDDGANTGLLCVVAEVTERVIADRRMGTLRDLGMESQAAVGELEAVEIACRHLEANPASLPFVLVYLFDDAVDGAVDGTVDGAGPVARLAGTAGVEPGRPVSPVLLDTRGPSVWPVAAAWDGDATDVDLTHGFDDLPTGAWADPPTTALVVPVLQAAGSHPLGLLVVGLNPHRPLDDSYRSFVTLVAGLLSAAVSDARAITFERERAETLARLDHAKSDFLANVSHELRTPLTLLLGPAEDALADVAHPLEGRQRDRVEVVVRNGTRMLSLINTLLDFSRLEAGEDDARFVATDLARYTTELAVMFDSAAERAGVDLVVDCPSEPASVAWVDRDHWAKIVLNLVSNALKFTFEGSVTVVLREDDGTYRLDVRDTGTGIPAGELPHVFDRFHRVSGARSRTHEGSGIGLALVAELARAHGGDVGVVSTPGVGSTFTVRVPAGHGHLPPEQVVGDQDVPDAVPDEVPDEVLARAGERLVASTDLLRDAPAAPTSEPGTSTGTGSGTILVVDDNPDMRRYVADLLRDAGYRVRVAADGVEALEAMRDQPADLVLTDVMMPRLDGFGLLREIRADDDLAATPVLMLSARAGEEGTVEGLDAGADDYLVKPFSARELTARVRVNLELDRASRLRRTLERSEELLDQAQRLARMGSWEVDLAADRIHGSATFREMVEHTDDELSAQGARATMRSLVHPDDLDRVLATLGGAAPGDLLDYEMRAVLPSGATRLFAVRAEVVVPDADGTSVLRGFFHDVTEQRATQQRLVIALAEREAATREREVADALQRSLLPSATIDLEPLDVATYYQAGTEGTQVGGDWYDVFDLGAGRVAVVIGDVMGRGVKAAAVMGQLRAAVRALARVDLGPAELLEYLETIVADLAEEQIVTCVYAVLDASSLTLSYANAGHPPLLVARADGVLRLGAGGPPLGAGFFGATTNVVELAPDDVLVLYTDGLVERRGSDLFDDIDRLVDLVGERRHLPVAAVVEQVVAAMAAGVSDDVAMVVARVVGRTCDAALHRRLVHEDLAPAHAPAAVTEHLVAWGVPEEVRDDVVLAVSELVTNAVLHARPPVNLRLELTGTQLLLEVQDRTSLRPRRRRPDDADEHGRGLNIVDALADSWGTRNAGGGKAVWCVFRW